MALPDTHVLKELEYPVLPTYGCLSTGIWSFDVASGISKWSPDLFTLLGREIGDYPPEPEGALTLIHPDDRCFVQEQMTLGISSIGHEIEYFCRMRHAEGQWLTFLCKGWVDRDELSRPIRVSGSLTQVRSLTNPKNTAESDRPSTGINKNPLTELSLAQDARLSKAEYRLRMALANSGLGVFDWDLITNTIEWDRQHESLWGLEPGQFPGALDAFIEGLHPDDASQVMHLLEAARTNRTPFFCRFRVIWPDKSEHWIESRGEFTYGRDGAAVRMFGTVADVTAHQNSQLQLKESEARFRSLFEHLPIAYQSLDAQGRWLDANEALAKLLGYSSREDMIGKEFAAHFDEETCPKFWEYFERFKRGEDNHQEFVLRKIDGTQIIVETAGRIQRDEEGRFLRSHRILIDLTEKNEYIQATEQLNKDLELKVNERTEQLKDALSLRSQFLAHMSHEIRNPMNIISVSTHLLGQSNLDQSQRNIIDRIKRASTSLIGFLDEILEFAKLERGEVKIESEPFDLNEIFTNLQGLHAPDHKEKNLRITFINRVDDTLSFSGDGRRINQILDNLIGNAIKFTDVGGITVEVSCNEVDRDHDELLFEVLDTGCGIAAKDIEDLFVPFKQASHNNVRNHKGTGLGLSICKGFVELMGGQIGVESTPGIGSRFWFRIPVNHGRDHLSGQRQGQSNLRLASLRLLLVDDEPLNVEALKELLEIEGADCVTATSGAEAIARLRSEPQGFNAVLLDIQMPEMNGIEATKNIRWLLGLGELPIIAVSAGITPEQQSLALSSGITHFVKKPINPDEIVEIISNYCLHQPPRQDARKACPDEGLSSAR